MVDKERDKQMTNVLLYMKDDEIRALMRLVLEKEGFTVTWTDNSQAAQHFLQNEAYTLFIAEETDVWRDWPAYDEFYRSMKADPILCTVGVIHTIDYLPIGDCCGLQIHDLDEEDHYLLMPFDLKALCQTIKKVFETYGHSYPG